jgi:hypothetical protein
MILHCHLYNARIQSTLEDSKLVDGAHIITWAAESVFSNMLTGIFRHEDTVEEKWKIVEELYSHLGYGKIDCSQVTKGIITALSGHYIEGWKSGFHERDKPVCTFTSGYLQGAFFAVTGESVYVHETECMIQGSPSCNFTVDRIRSEPVVPIQKTAVDFQPKGREGAVESNIDEAAIVGALVGMPIHGNEEGLIPGFSVYLSSTPADYYNLVTSQFMQEMNKVNLSSAARKMLVYSAEVCGMSTFRGIMNSPEWEGLIAPMIKEERDNVFALVAVSNALGWGNWYVSELVPGQSLKMVSRNGYEAIGYREIQGVSDESRCYMLTGVGASFMQLVYGRGQTEDRYGSFYASEHKCISKRDDVCEFTIEAVN